MSIDLIGRNFYEDFKGFVISSNHNINIVSPFIGRNTSLHMANLLPQEVKLRIITKFVREDFIKGVSSIEGLIALHEAGAEIYIMKNLHTKLYTFDTSTAIVTSANFTNGGLVNNFELGLLIQNESIIISEIIQYFDSLQSEIVKYDEENGSNNLLTPEILLEEERIVNNAIRQRPVGSTNFNNTQQGAELNSNYSVDIIEDSFDVQISNDRDDLWLKFEADSNHRLDNTLVYFDPEIRRKQQRPNLTFFPRQPISLKNGHKIYITVVSWDRANNPTTIIVGRAKTRGFNKENMVTRDTDFYESWMSNYPYYVEIYDVESFNGPIIEGISILDLYRDINYKTYPSTKNASRMNVEKLKIYHKQKDKIRITEAAANYIDEEIDKRIELFGKIEI